MPLQVGHGLTAGLMLHHSEIGDSNPRVPDAAENGLGPEAAQQPHQPFAITISEPPQQQQQQEQQQEEEPEQQQQPKQGSNHVAAKVSN